MLVYCKLTICSLQDAGLSTAEAFNLNLGNSAMLIGGTLIVWGCKSAILARQSRVYTDMCKVINRIGRRSIYLIGQALMAVQLGLIGVLGCIPPSTGVSYGIGALMMTLTFTFACTLGPVCYTIVAELPSAEVRSQTVVIARATYVISGLINDQLTPRMLGTADWVRTAHGLGTYPGLMWLTVLEHRCQVRFLLPRHKHLIVHLLLLPSTRVTQQNLRRTRYPVQQQGSRSEVFIHQCGRV